MTKSFARGSVAMVALAGLLAAAPAMAFTHHPSTPAERQQTKDLNLQSLAAAQGQAPANQMAANMNAAAPAPTDMTTQPSQAPATTTPSDQQAAPMQPQQPATQPAQQPAPADNTQQAPAPQ